MRITVDFKNPITVQSRSKHNQDGYKDMVVDFLIWQVSQNLSKTAYSVYLWKSPHAPVYYHIQGGGDEGTYIFALGKTELWHLRKCTRVTALQQVPKKHFRSKTGVCQVEVIPQGCVVLHANHYSSSFMGQAEKSGVCLFV